MPFPNTFLPLTSHIPKKTLVWRLYSPNSRKDAMNVLDSPQVNRLLSKRIQVTLSYNGPQSPDGFFSVYSVNFISSIQTPDSDSTVTGPRHDVSTKWVHC